MQLIRDFIKNAFPIYDEDGNGVLDKDEITNLLKEICDGLGLPPVNQSQVDKCFSSIDVDNSGDIDFKELIRSAKMIYNVLI